MSSRSWNPITQQIAFEKMGRIMLVFPLFPYTAPPTEAAMSPREQNTEASPKANDNVGRTISLSSRSPAAVDMYDMVRGSKPHTHGENAVNKPAPYMMGMLDTRLDGSSSDTDAIEEAVD